MKDLEEDYVNYEIAEMLKNKGFPIGPCHAFYNPIKKELIDLYSYMTDSNRNTFIAAPTHQMVNAWFRNKYDIHIFVSPFYNSRRSNKVYGASVNKHGRLIAFTQKTFKEYKDCMDNSIKYVLENLIE